MACPLLPVRAVSWDSLGLGTDPGSSAPLESRLPVSTLALSYSSHLTGYELFWVPHSYYNFS